MSLDTNNVTVSLSRLALAKAIKTPDADEPEAESWTKSVIFNQSHVSESMRKSILFPSGQQQRMPPARQQPQRQSFYPTNNSQRSSSPHLVDSDSAASPSLEQHSITPSSGSIVTPSERNYIPSTTRPDMLPKSSQYASDDDDDKDEEGEIEEEEDDDKESTDGVGLFAPSPRITLSFKESSPRPEHVSRSSPPVLPPINLSLNEGSSRQPPRSVRNRTSQYLPPASDDEDEEDDESVGDDNDDDDESQEDMKARRMSTLRQLERGPSVHKRSRSHSDLNPLQNPYVGQNDKSDAIERWRQGVATQQQSMEEEDNNSSLRSSMGSFMRPPQQQRRSRQSTMGSMDYHNNMMMMPMPPQMQWQMQQQMVQIQQYQQQQWQQDNRKSVSAMDLLTQIEKEKQDSSPSRSKPKAIAAGERPIQGGLLSRLPPKNTHSMNFQQLQQTDARMRASPSELTLANSTSQRVPRENKSGKKKMTSTDARRRSEMIKSESVPNLCPSKSTPSPLHSSSSRHSRMMYNGGGGPFFAPPAMVMMPPNNQPLPYPAAAGGGRPMSVMYNPAMNWPGCSSSSSSTYR